MNWISLSCIFATICLKSASVWALESPCRKLFQTQQYLEAASCYEQLAQSIDKKTELASVASMLKDRFVYNAAVCYQRAAEADKRIEVRGFFLEKATSLLQRAEREGLCQATNRCEKNKAFLSQLQLAIEYGQIIVLTGKPDIAITVEGYQFKQQATETFNQKLRPGPYKITITRKGESARIKQVDLKPHHSAVIDAKPAEIKFVEKRIIVAKKIPPLVLVGYIVGGALLLAGAVLAVVGYANQNSLNTCRQDANCSQPNDAYHREFDQAGTLIVVGYLGASVGILTFGAGVVAHIAANRAAETSPPKITPSMSLGHFQLP